MNLTAWLDVAIGLSIVYLGASLFVTIINEYVSQFLNLRGKNLYRSLEELIDETGVRAKLKEYPALEPFFDGGARKAASYVDSLVLAKLLLGSLAASPAELDPHKRISDGIDGLPDSKLKKQLQAIVKVTPANLEELVDAVERWADRSLTALGENYKKHLQTISLIIGLIVAIGFNVDSISLTTELYRDKEARGAAVELAVQTTTSTNEATFEKCLALAPEQRKTEAECAGLMGLVDAVTSRNEKLGQLPIGWAAVSGPMEPGAWALKGLGWLLTALALSQGAPFWFDFLNRFINVRHGMRKPEASSKPAAK